MRRSLSTFESRPISSARCAPKARSSAGWSAARAPDFSHLAGHRDGTELPESGRHGFSSCTRHRHRRQLVCGHGPASSIGYLGTRRPLRALRWSMEPPPRAALLVVAADSGRLPMAGRGMRHGCAVRGDHRSLLAVVRRGRRAVGRFSQDRKIEPVGQGGALTGERHCDPLG